MMANEVKGELTAYFVEFHQLHYTESIRNLKSRWYNILYSKAITLKNKKGFFVRTKIFWALVHYLELVQTFSNFHVQIFSPRLMYLRISLKVKKFIYMIFLRLQNNLMCGISYIYNYTHYFYCIAVSDYYHRREEFNHNL